MSWITRTTILLVALPLACAATAHATNYPTAVVTISGSASTANGTMTIAFNGYSETVSYGPLSTPASIASAFAAEFSADPVAEQHPRLCTAGVCAKASGATITFQLVTGTFGAFTFSSTGVTPFVARNKLQSATSTIANPMSSGLGSSVMLTATVTPAVPTGNPVIPTGSVSILDGQTVLGYPNLVNGVATMSVSTLTVGTHSITATYSGDTTYEVSSSQPPIQVTVTNAGPVTLSISQILPSSAPLGYMPPIYIVGSGFTSSSIVVFNGTPIGGTFVTSTEMTFTLPSNAVTGPALVTVTTGNTTSNGKIFMVGAAFSCPVHP